MAHKVAIARIPWEELEAEPVKVKRSFQGARKAYVIGSILVTVLMIGVSFGVMISAEVPTGFPTVIEPGSQVSKPTIVVYSSGSTYYVKNGTTGATDASNTNATTAIISAISLLPSSGGTINILAGQYNIDSKLSIPSSTVVEGVGTATVIRTDYYDWSFALDHVKNVTIRDLTIQSRLGGYGIWADNSSEIVIERIRSNDCWNHVYALTCTNISVSDSVFRGGMYGIRLWWVSNVVVSRNILSDFTTDAIQLNAASSCVVYGNVVKNWGISSTYKPGIGVYASGGNCSGITIAGNTLFAALVDKANIGIYIGAEQGIGWNTHHCVVSGNSLIGQNANGTFSSIGIYVHAFSGAITNMFGIQVIGNVIENWTAGVSIAGGMYIAVSSNVIHNSGDNGIGLTILYYSSCTANMISMPSRDNPNACDGIALTGSRYCEIISNSIEDRGSPGRMRSGIRETDSGAMYNYIVSNRIWGNQSEAIFRTGATSTVKYNYGYVTEAYGNQSITGAVSSITFNHGLVATPLLVLVTPAVAFADNYTVTTTAAQITITFDSQPGATTWYFHWYAQTW